jgi:hypothetical protein
MRRYSSKKPTANSEKIFETKIDVFVRSPLENGCCHLVSRNGNRFVPVPPPGKLLFLP